MADVTQQPDAPAGATDSCKGAAASAPDAATADATAAATPSAAAPQSLAGEAAPTADTEGAAEAAEAGPGSSKAAAAEDNVSQITFKVQYGKNSQELKRPATSTVAQLKAEVEKALAIPPARQKLMFRGLLKDGDTLAAVGLKNGAKVLLIGSSQADIAAAKPAGAAADAGGASLAWDAPKEVEDITKQTQHAKVLSKGVPEDVMPGIPDRQVPLPDTLLHFNNLLSSSGNKLRLTFKPELQQLWVASATSTQKIPYSQVTRIEAHAIPEHPGYCILCLYLGAGGTSRYWLYFFPAQYVSGVKIRLLGVQALL